MYLHWKGQWGLQGGLLGVAHLTFPLLSLITRRLEGFYYQNTSFYAKLLRGGGGGGVR